MSPSWNAAPRSLIEISTTAQYHASKLQVSCSRTETNSAACIGDYVKMAHTQVDQGKGLLLSAAQ